MTAGGGTGRGLRRARASAAVVAAGLHAAGVAWNLAHAAKGLLLADRVGEVPEWARRYYHPEQASLLPYVAACLAALAFGLVLYAAAGAPRRRAARWLLGRLAIRSPAFLVASGLLAPLAVGGSLPPLAGLAVGLASLAPLLLPAPRRHAGAADRPRAGRRRIGALPAVSILATGALLAAMSVEPLRLVRGPTRLVNEYAPLGAPSAPGEEDEPSRAEDGPPRPADVGLGATPGRIERFYQASQRGQVNHVGQILNPIGERLAGRPVDQITHQYGWGATRVFEWIMRPFGGPSFQAFYKAHLAYLAYWLLVVAAAATLLRDARHVLVATVGVAAAYYGLGYRSLLVAPGINPILHFLDLPILLLAWRHFHGRGTGWLAAGGVAVATAVWLNGFYGSMQAIAFLAAAGLFALEAPAGARWRGLATLAAALALPLAVALALLPGAGGRSGDFAFALGWYSWRPAAGLVVLTLAWLAAGYLHLAWRRHDRHPLKYAALYLFVYAQGYLVYAFWSGLSNHFWPVLPYVVFHLLVVARDLGRDPAGARLEWATLAVLFSLLAVGADVSNGLFVTEKLDFRRNFQHRPTWEWPFPRARVISPADPAPLVETLSMIERLSPDPRRGVCVLSIFGNLVPFLSGRASTLPTFELQWEIWSEAGRRRVLDALRSDPPELLFVGNELEDPRRATWATGGEDRSTAAELAALRGRLVELRRLFEQVAPGYERVEAGPLLSAYRRRAAAAP